VLQEVHKKTIKPQNTVTRTHDPSNNDTTATAHICTQRNAIGYE